MTSAPQWRFCNIEHLLFRPQFIGAPLQSAPASARRKRARRSPPLETLTRGRCIRMADVRTARSPAPGGPPTRTARGVRVCPPVRTRPAHFRPSARAVGPTASTSSDSVCVSRCTGASPPAKREIGQLADRLGHLGPGPVDALGCLARRLRRLQQVLHGLTAGRSTVVEKYPGHHASRVKWMAAAMAAPYHAATQERPCMLARCPARAP